MAVSPDTSEWGALSWLLSVATAIVGGVGGAMAFVMGTRARLDAHEERLGAIEREGRDLRAALDQTAKADDLRRLEGKIDAHNVATMTAILALNVKRAQD